MTPELPVSAFKSSDVITVHFESRLGCCRMWHSTNETQHRYVTCPRFGNDEASEKRAPPYRLFAKLLLSRGPTSPIRSGIGIKHLRALTIIDWPPARWIARLRHRGSILRVFEVRRPTLLNVLILVATLISRNPSTVTVGALDRGVFRSLPIPRKFAAVPATAMIPRSNGIGLSHTYGADAEEVFCATCRPDSQ